MKIPSRMLEDSQRIDRLEKQMRKLRWITYFIWPAVWLISISVIFGSTRQDANATRLFLNWIQTGFFGLLVAFMIVMMLGFLLKVASDFKNRKHRYALNPGSKSPPAGPAYER